MGASVRPDPVADYLAARKAQSAQSTPSTPSTATLDPVTEYLDAKKRAGSGRSIHDEYASGALAKRMARENANDRESVDAEGPSYAQQALGGIASLARDIPGAEVLQAGARSLVRGQSYRDALGDIRSGEESAPAAARVGNRMIGGTVAALTLPGRIGGKMISPAMQAAGYGALDGLAQADPDAGIGARLKDAGVNAAIGGTVGKLADAGGNLARSVLSKTRGEQDAALRAGMRAADRQNYGAAGKEGRQAGGSDPLLRSVMGSSDIQPYVKMVTGTRQFAGASDTKVAAEAYKQMTKQQQGIARRLAENGYDAKLQLEHDDLGLAKEELRRAMSRPMPSIGNAIDTHAEFQGQRDAARNASRATKTVLGGKQAADTKLHTAADPTSFIESAARMSPAESQAALEAVLARTKDKTGGSLNPLKLFGLGSSLSSAGSVTPLVQALEANLRQPAQPLVAALKPVAGTVPSPMDLLRALVASQGHPAP